MKKIIASKATYMVIQVFGIIIAGIGGLTICGYIAGEPTMYTWKGSQGMALNTSIAFVFNGISFYIIGNFIKLFITKS